MTDLMLSLPEEKDTKAVGPKEILMVTNGDLRESANTNCWPVQEKYEQKLSQVLKEQFGYTLIRAHDINRIRKHGFIASQREGCDVFSGIDPNAPVIVLLTAWQYSHHLASSLAHHQGPILLLANFDGTWPGLVGTLCMAGTLTGLGTNYSRLWSENFDDAFFLESLGTWLHEGQIIHDISYLKEITLTHPMTKTEAARIGWDVGKYILRNKEIIGLFDSYCMGMMNGVFPLKMMVNIGMPIESLSQSALFYEMSQVPDDLCEECLNWYENQGMKFNFGTDEKTELTRSQVLKQCAMLIAMARISKRFGLTSVGVQYQQGLKDLCPASDFAEGAIGSATRFPIPDEDGQIIRPDKPIPCINEVDMGTAIPQTMLYRLLDSLNLPSETTLHDIRWGSEFEGIFYWDFEISGAVPFEHLKGGIRGAKGYRQPAMYFPKGGSTISGQCKSGRFIWARANYQNDDVILHVGTGHAVELPEAEFQRRLNATTSEWPLMNCVLDGVSRDELMAGHQSNHITVAYVDEQYIDDVVDAFVSQALAQNMRVFLAGKGHKDE
ncbi:hypothetical protein [Vibrio salinus]|uniref:hypothetical protein n=1 Tax=Vibrio salinus TaxID=2899784 RepID=UPI001E5C5DF9|nr:hypothetical protein [Vibrio salinus]MCE0495632.1 hypothetical protein [Vibrio salinus]